ncbi:UNVERIFIED_CONTAM: hypothetical protein Sradi_4570600 [Sesamum radiatum]|uniref:Uncharacterized protein n=1 Tax=Sesamum radiatum TaxID=300843 RepID=A0AAW2NC72_SESRA
MVPLINANAFRDTRNHDATRNNNIPLPLLIQNNQPPAVGAPFDELKPEIAGEIKPLTQGLSRPDLNRPLLIILLSLQGQEHGCRSGWLESWYGEERGNPDA